MGLKETIEETRKQLETITAKEAEDEKSALEEFNKNLTGDDKPKDDEKPKPDVSETPKEEDKKEEPKAEETKNEDKKAEEKLKTPAEHAAERVAKKKERDSVTEELARARERIAALEATAQKPIVEQKPVATGEPDATTNPLGWVVWKQQQLEQQFVPVNTELKNLKEEKAQQNLRQSAFNEIAVYEDHLRKTAKDYDDVKNWYGGLLMASIKFVNPRITQPQLIEAVNNRLLTRAAELQAEGYENPIEAMYLEAKGLGYQPKEKAEEKKEEPKPDFDKVTKLQKRNAGTVGSSGSGGDQADVTPATAAKMTNREWMKLKPEEKRRVFERLRG